MLRVASLSLTLDTNQPSHGRTQPGQRTPCPCTRRKRTESTNNRRVSRPAMQQHVARSSTPAARSTQQHFACACTRSHIFKAKRSGLPAAVDRGWRGVAAQQQLFTVKVIGKASNAGRPQLFVFCKHLCGGIARAHPTRCTLR